MQQVQHLRRKAPQRAFTVPQGLTEHRVVIGQGDTLPIHPAVALQPHEAFVGSYKLSPLKLTQHDLSPIEVTVDGALVGPQLEMDFTNKCHARAYAHTVVLLGRPHSGYDNGVDYDVFGDNKTVFVWSLATEQGQSPVPQAQGDAGHRTMLQDGARRTADAARTRSKRRSDTR